MRKPPTPIFLAAVLVLFVLMVVPDLAAQEAGGVADAARPVQRDLRAFWHVFAAYTIVIVLIGGWTISIARRLRDVEDRLVD